MSQSEPAEKRRRTIGGYGLLGVLALIAAGLTVALWPRGPAEDPQRVQVGFYENPPKLFTDRTGEPAGLFIDLLTALAAWENWEVHYVHCAWAECLEKLRAGEIDLMPDVALTEERRETMDFHSIPVAESWSQVYAPSGSDLVRQEDLDGRRIAVLEDSSQDQHFATLAEDTDFNYQRLALAHMDEVFAAVRDGDAEAAVTNHFHGRHRRPEYRLVETPITFDHVSLYFAASPERTLSLLEPIDQRLADWKAEPESVYYRSLEDAVRASVEPGTPGWLLPTLVSAAVSIALLALGILLLRWRVREQNQALDATNQRLQHLLDGSPVILYALRGPNLTPAWCSGNIERLLGFTVDEALEPTWWERQTHPEDRPTAEAEAAKVLREGHLVHEYRVYDADGNVRYVRDELQVVPGSVERGNPEVIGSWTDITESREQKHQLQYLSQYDTRTGLPNRSLLGDRVRHTLDQARAQNSSRHLILLDIDRFKSINDTLGMAAGDQVLQAVARRLEAVIHDEDTVARVGADEFCLVLESPWDHAQITRFMDELMERFREPLDVNGRQLVLTASAGISRYPDDGRSADHLITAAELAAAEATRQGGNAWRRFETSMGEHSSTSLLMESALRQAVPNNELVLHYQPQFELATGAMSGMEALVRWIRPGEGRISPGQFIPLAEETGIIRDIDRWVLEEACRQLADWDARGLRVPRISVNLCAGELHDEGLVERIGHTLDRHGLAPGRIEVEITESMLMQAPERSMRVLRQLDELGLRLSMDDFGTGYSNLAYLRSLPLHQLKVDQSFVRDIGQSTNNESIIRAIIALADALQLELVAEGIEEPHQRDFLAREHCRIGQGFLFGRPGPANELEYGGLFDRR